MTIDIVGAGIGGLTAAIALQQKGIHVRVYEQALELKPIGAGIILANNAMQVYDKLGIKNTIERQGVPVSSIKITSRLLAPWSIIDLKSFETKYSCRNIAIHRAQLQNILIRNLKPNTLNLGYTLSEIQPGEQEHILRFGNQMEINAQVTIGADGLNSVVRNHLFPDTKIRSALQVCWRGIAQRPLPSNHKHELNEAWGAGNRFGFVPIDTERVYWYALSSFNVSPDEYSVENLSEYFADYHETIRNLIEATPSESVHTAIIEDLHPIKDWFKGSVGLLGDAAHATTPNMGQGAGQAIEDAYVLSELLAKYPQEKAFSRYQHLRMPKVKRVVHTSWRMGQVAHWKNPLARGIRNTLIKITPNDVRRRSLERVFELETVS